MGRSDTKQGQQCQFAPVLQRPAHAQFAHDAGQREAVDNDIGRLIAVYDQMKPEQAAMVLSNLPPDFAAQILVRVQPETGARIMAAVEPGQAAVLTSYMGAVTTAAR